MGDFLRSDEQHPHHHFISVSPLWTCFSAGVSIRGWMPTSRNRDGRGARLSGSSRASILSFFFTIFCAHEKKIHWPKGPFALGRDRAEPSLVASPISFTRRGFLMPLDFFSLPFIFSLSLSLSSGFLFEGVGVNDGAPPSLSLPLPPPSVH